MPLPNLQFRCPQCGRAQWATNPGTYALTLVTKGQTAPLGFHPNRGVIVRVAFCQGCGFGAMFQADVGEAPTEEEITRYEAG